MAGHREPGQVGSRSAARDLPLTEAKFRPPAVLLDAVVRRRLLRLLSQGGDRPLTLLSAPAGYGKTVLVACWAPGAEVTSMVVHMRMDDGDQTTQGFWTSAVEGLRRAGLDVTGVHETASARAAVEAMLRRLAHRILVHGEPVVWVLDCGEYSLSPALGDAIGRLIDQCGTSLRVVLLTRSDPPLPLHNYRLTDAITEIRAADLAFTATEASRLMRRAGLALDPVDLTALQERTGGWPAGLKFAAMSLSGRADTAEAIREFRGDTGNVAAYLMDEVLATQPPDTREFLLRTCIAEELDPGLVGALTGLQCDPRALEFMAHGNSFIEPVPGVRCRYRYSSLFREFLRSRLSYERPALVPELHRTAAEWLVAHGQRMAAIRHAVSAQAWPAAATYLVDGRWVGHLLIGDQRAVLRDVFSGLPEDARGADSALVRAAMALTELDVGRCTTELLSARTLLGEKDWTRAPALPVLEAIAASLGPDLDAALDAALVAERALQLVPNDDAPPSAELKVLVDGCLARVLFQRGDLQAALAAGDRGMKAAHGADLEEASTALQGMNALVEAASGRLRIASRLASRAGPQDDLHTDPASPAATLALAWVRVDEYDLVGAEELLAAYADGVGTSFDAKALGMVHALLRARLLSPRGDFDLARAGLRAARAPSVEGEATGWLDQSLVVAQASSFLAEDRPDDAITTIRECAGCDRIESTLLLQEAAVARGENGAGSTPRPRPTPAEAALLAVQVSSWLVRAAQSIVVEDLADGEVCVEKALNLAAPEHLRRPFLEAPEKVRRLFEHGNLKTRSRWLNTPGSARGDDPVHGGPGEQLPHPGHEGRHPLDPVLNPLTAKEREVLGYLAELLTTEEVAATMFVSVNTVRSHVRSILRKLGVTKRNDAVRRAWDLGLLPPRTAA